ncbi:MAG: nucleoside hydrolase [Armatimonadetes bacterium]|nr:nucleoside hydrolase [Armatimonadota bacterium]
MPRFRDRVPAALSARPGRACVSEKDVYTAGEQAGCTPREQAAFTPRKQAASAPTEQAAFTPREQAFTPEERRLLERLPHLASPAPFVLLLDPGFDVDDESALVVAASLHRRGVIDLQSVVTTTDPSDRRASLTKGALKKLGLPHVPVAIGDSHRPPGFNPHPERLESPFSAPFSELRADALGLFKETLEKALDHSVVLLVAARMTDANNLLHAEEALFQQKVKQVVLMGGVQQTSEENDSSAADLKLAGGLMAANTQATNNRHDQPAADAFYRRLQELDVKVKVVTRKAATNTPVGPDFFKDLEQTGHPVAGHLRTIEGAYLNEFWQAACKGEMGPERNARWFIETFCKPGTPSDLSPDEDIRPHLKGRVLYDAVALLAGVDELADELFEPVTVPVRNARDEVIGLSQKVHGLREPQRLATLLSALAKDGCRPPP